MADDPEDEAIPCKGTMISVCEQCKSVHIILLDADMIPFAISNVSFTAWMEIISKTFDDIEKIDGRDGQPAEGAIH